MKNIKLTLAFFFILCLLLNTSQAQEQELGVLKEIIINRLENKLEAKIVLDKPYNYTKFTLPNPNRLIIDFPQFKGFLCDPSMEVDHSGVIRIRLGRFKLDVTRVVFDWAEKCPSYEIKKNETELTVIFWFEEEKREIEEKEPAKVEEKKAVKEEEKPPVIKEEKKEVKEEEIEKKEKEVKEAVIEEAIGEKKAVEEKKKKAEEEKKPPVIKEEKKEEKKPAEIKEKPVKEKEKPVEEISEQLPEEITLQEKIAVIIGLNGGAYFMHSSYFQDLYGKSVFIIGGEAVLKLPLGSKDFIGTSLSFTYISDNAKDTNNAEVNLEMMPISFSGFYMRQIGVFSPYFGAGIDYHNYKEKYSGASSDLINSGEVWGTNFLAGTYMKLSSSLSLKIYYKYHSAQLKELDKNLNLGGNEYGLTLAFHFNL